MKKKYFFPTLLFVVSIFLFSNSTLSQITYYVVKGKVIDKNTKGTFAGRICICAKHNFW